MNILIVHEVSYAKKVVYEYQEFAEQLSARGHRVTVIDYDESGDCDFLERSISRTGIGSVTVWNIPYANYPIIKYLSGRSNYPRLLERAIREGRVDVVLLYSVFINGTQTLTICGDHRIPVVYRVLDAYHELRQNFWISIILRSGESRIYRDSDVVCLTNNRMATYVNSIAGRSVADRTVVVDHGVDISKFAPNSRDIALCARHGIDIEDRVALFVGTLYTFCGVDKVVRGFDNLLRHAPTAKIVIVGDGPLMPLIRQIVSDGQLQDRVVITGMRPFEEIPRWLSVANIAFNSFEINSITRNIIPIKMLQYMAAGLPVISAPIPDVMRIFPEISSGARYWDVRDAGGFTDLMGRTLADADECSNLGRAARSTIEKGYGLSRAIDSLELILMAQVARSRAEPKSLRALK